MNTITRFLSLVAAVPVVALFGGVGVLAFQIGQTWEAANTRMLLSILGTSCLGGTVVLAVVLGLVVGLPLALRIGAGRAERRQGREVPPARILTARRVDPPGWDAPAGTEAGSWRSDGPLAYDLWEQATPWEGPD